MNPATKQYFVFSLIVALILSAIINFGFIELIKGSFIYGFPFNLNNLEGFGAFLARVVNTLVMGAFLAIPTYFILRELDRRR